MPRQLVATEECVAVASPQGTVFRDYYSPERLEEHLLLLAPAEPPSSVTTSKPLAPSPKPI